MDVIKVNKVKITSVANIFFMGRGWWGSWRNRSERVRNSGK